MSAHEQEVNALSECVKTLFAQNDIQKKHIEKLGAKLQEVAEENNYLKQLVFAKLVKSESGSSDAYGPTEKDLLSKSDKLKHLKISALVLAIILIGTTIAVYLTFTLKSSEKKPEWKAYLLQGNGRHLLYPRESWIDFDDSPAIPPLRHPTNYVIIGHTVTPICHNFKECCLKLNSMRSYQINKKNLPDLSYNFVVGGDGNVYSVLGWDKSNFIRNDSIMISVTGNFVFDVFTQVMQEAIQNLLDDGVRLRKLSPNYILMGHNQTASTESPGANIYSEIKTWKHFRVGRFI